MKRIPKDLADKMVEDVLIAISKLDDIPSDFAKDSLDIMDNPTDNLIFTGILLGKAKPTLFNDNEHSTFNNIREAVKSAWTQCYIPELEECRKYLQDI